jgi:predicted enzyme related to lactoylglutathione lyase
MTDRAELARQGAAHIVIARQSATLNTRVARWGLPPRWLNEGARLSSAWEEGRSMLRYVKFANLPVRDQDRAISFYRDKLGLSVAADEPYGGGWRWIELEMPGAQTRIVFTQRESDAPAEQPSLILICDDVDRSFRDLSAKGVEFTQTPTKAPWRPGELYALLRDTEGNLVMLGRN